MYEDKNKNNLFPENIISNVETLPDLTNKLQDDKIENNLKNNLVCSSIDRISPSQISSAQPIKKQDFDFPKDFGRLGLRNLGNTCYMNVALQVLSHTKEVVNYFIQNEYKRDLDHQGKDYKNLEHMVRYDFVHNFADLIKEQWSTCKKETINPSEIRQSLVKLFPQFGDNTQQDAHEILMCILDTLHQVLNRKNGDFITDENLLQLSRHLSQRCWDSHKQTNDSIITDLFFGQLKSTIKCQECQYENFAYDPFSILGLPIPNEYKILIYFVPLKRNNKPMSLFVKINDNMQFKNIVPVVKSLVDYKFSTGIFYSALSNKLVKVVDPDERCGDLMNRSSFLFLMETVEETVNEESRVKIQNGENFLTDNLKYGTNELNWGSNETNGSNGGNRINGHYNLPSDKIPFNVCLNYELIDTENCVENSNNVNTNLQDSELRENNTNQNQKLNPQKNNSANKKIKSNVTQESQGNDTQINVNSKCITPCLNSSSNAVINRKHISFPRMFSFNLIQSKEEFAEEIRITNKIFDTLSSYTRQYVNDNNYGEVDPSKEGKEKSHASNSICRTSNQLYYTIKSIDKRDYLDTESYVNEFETAKIQLEKSKDHLMSKSNNFTCLFCDKEKDLSFTCDCINRILSHQNSDTFENKFQNSSLIYYIKNRKADSALLIEVNCFISPDVIKFREMNRCKDLSQHYQHETRLSLEDLLTYFTADEKLTLQENYKCNNCNRYVVAYKKMEVNKFPPILAINLKRFRYEANQNFSRGRTSRRSESGSGQIIGEKNEVQVDFAINNLNLTKYNKNVNIVYELFAVCNHSGKLDKGHYTAICKHPTTKKWIEYDDKLIRNDRQVESIVSSNAYMLFYRKK